MEDDKQYFASCMYSCDDIINFDEKNTFNEYHYYEEYDSTKTYDKNPFEYDYGHGKHTYVYKLYEIGLMEGDQEIKRKKYIIADEEIGKTELTELAKYCQCSICISKWYNLSRYFTCSCCIGCLKSSFPQQYQINKARKHIVENKINI